MVPQRDLPQKQRLHGRAFTCAGTRGGDGGRVKSTWEERRALITGPHTGEGPMPRGRGLQRDLGADVTRLYQAEPQHSCHRQPGPATATGTARGAPYPEGSGTATAAGAAPQQRSGLALPPLNPNTRTKKGKVLFYSRAKQSPKSTDIAGDPSGHTFR